MPAKTRLEAADGGPAAGALQGLFRSYRGRILFTYGLFSLENSLRLAQPFALGLAINDLLASSYRGLAVLAAQLLAFMLVGSWRRVYDARAFTGIYTELATRLVLEQRRRAEDLSRIAARSALSRAFVDFFERDVPGLMQALFSVAGAFVMLGFYDPLLIPFCLAIVAPAGVLNFAYGRKALALNGRLHDQLEREVQVIGRGGPGEVGDHYRGLARWRVQLANWEALNCALMELFVLGLIVAALVRFCGTPGASAGAIFAVFRYVMLFISGLDSAPALVQQISRLRDIGGRLRHGDPSEVPAAATRGEAAGG